MFMKRKTELFEFAESQSLIVTDKIYRYSRR